MDKQDKASEHTIEEMAVIIKALEMGGVQGKKALWMSL